MKIFRLIVIGMACGSALAQGPPSRVRGPRPTRGADMAEMAVKQAAEQLAFERKGFERDVEVLRHLRTADDALADTMQPSTVIQKAFEEVSAAERLAPDFVVMQGVIRARQALDDARKSPGMADFGKLRGTIRSEALGPASRVAVRNASRLQDDTTAWLRIQQLIADHLRTLSDIASTSLRAAEQ